MSFSKTLEPGQYNPTVAIIYAIRFSYEKKFWKELGFESLQQKW